MFLLITINKKGLLLLLMTVTNSHIMCILHLTECRKDVECICVGSQHVVLMPVLEASRYQWVAVDVRELEFQSSNWLCFPTAGCIQPGPKPLPTAPSLFVWRHCSCLHLSLLIRSFILFALITARRVTPIHCAPFSSLHHTLGSLWPWNARARVRVSARDCPLCSLGF